MSRHKEFEKRISNIIFIKVSSDSDKKCWRGSTRSENKSILASEKCVCTLFLDWERRIQFVSNGIV